MVDLNFTDLFSRLRVILYLLTAISLYRSCQLFFSCYISISNYSSIFSMPVVSGPFWALRVLTIYFLA
jgi:hypothetical protein